MGICVKNLAATKANVLLMANGAFGRVGKLAIKHAAAGFKPGSANATIHRLPTTENIASVHGSNRESVRKSSVQLMGRGASGFSGVFAQVSFTLKIRIFL